MWIYVMIVVYLASMVVAVVIGSSVVHEILQQGLSDFSKQGSGTSPGGEGGG